MFRKEFKTLNRIEISKENILSNYDLFQKLHPRSHIWPVLKSNAYGHEIQTISKILKERKFEYFVVDSYYEALKIWEVNKQPCLLIGYTHPTIFANINFKKLAITVYDEVTIQTLGKINQPINIHLKINTGMNRQGIDPNKIETFINLIKQYPNLNLEGVLTHLCDGDNLDTSFTENQINEFKNCIEKLEKHFDLKYIHAAQTNGSTKVNDTKFNTIRLGIGLYGFPSIQKEDPAYTELKDLKPALKFTSTLVNIREIKKGEKLGYNCTYTASQDMKIGLLPVGYNDGLDRRLSNKGFVKYQNKFLPILGRVSMNLTSFSLEGVDAKHLDEVEIISPKPNDKNSIESIAKICDTIPYDILVGLDTSTKRIVST